MLELYISKQQTTCIFKRYHPFPFFGPGVSGLQVSGFGCQVSGLRFRTESDLPQTTMEAQLPTTEKGSSFCGASVGPVALVWDKCQA